MIAWLKLVHIGAIAVWMAGLVSLPGLYVQRAHVKDADQLFRLQRMVRFAYLALVSPAAFLAIGTGIALIFARGVFEGWLSAKLALVGGLALLHTLTGLVIIRLFREGEVYPVWRFVAVTALTVAFILGILYLVLAKPPLDAALLMPAAMSEPGALRRVFEDLNPWMRP
ncbi:CopD family protein [Chelativorans sp. AA-79]|uniref:CopD family protein n=1 Tax=Chelativorans sp. AA-79 TaxID=3028735 RepID=UPI0023F75A2E|nr:CopD family protein [Chelativorans sp. AA-79]WEX10907.1 CopD family protein [Chelativorans sp. AA-79]